MIRVHNIRIGVKTIREFFKYTNSTPSHLIQWMNRNIKLREPCRLKPYRGKFIFIDTCGHGFLLYFQEEKEYLYFPSFIPLDDLHRYLQDDKVFKKFKKDLRKFEHSSFKKGKQNK